MISIPERLHIAVLCGALTAAVGCGLAPPPEPPPLDCGTIDRAVERFPEECGEATATDAGAGDAP